MNTLETILLGIVQGLTEFLPISSSGHLVIFQNLLGFTEPELLLDCALHLGTLAAVCLYLRADIKLILSEILRGDFKGPGASLAWMVAAGTVPTVLIALAFRDHLESAFASVFLVGCALIATGCILLVPKLAGGRLRGNCAVKMRVGLLAALAAGAVQGLAVTPGISRSGITIVTGLLLGLDRDLAGRFSFLLSIPAIIGAVVLQFNLDALARVGTAPLIAGFAAAAVIGFFALTILMGMLRKGHLHYFAPYCWAAGLAAILLS